METDFWKDAALEHNDFDPAINDSNDDRDNDGTDKKLLIVNLSSDPYFKEDLEEDSSISLEDADRSLDANVL